MISLALSACATSTRSLKKVEFVKGTSKDALAAVREPIYDTNLIKREIPQALKDIEKVYQAPPNCLYYRQELAELNQALGDDLIDVKVKGSDTLTINLSETISSNLMPGIPFSSIVRSLSGAKKHELKRLDAIFRGKSRRAFLKGWALGQDCLR